MKIIVMVFVIFGLQVLEADAGVFSRLAQRCRSRRVSSPKKVVAIPAPAAPVLVDSGVISGPPAPAVQSSIPETTSSPAFKLLDVPEPVIQVLDFSLIGEQVKNTLKKKPSFSLID